MTMKSVRVLVSGVVQGVGFRPYCYRLAVKHKLNGCVRNLRDAGMELRLEGDSRSIDNFLRELGNKPPIQADIQEIQVKEKKVDGFSDFIIEDSGGTGIHGIIPADTGLCNKCLKELFDRKNGRHLYPFISCVDCGPRFTILGKPPFDRENISLSEFKPCKNCEHEYNTPSDRRFNYRGICCPDCGPNYFLLNASGSHVEPDNPVKEAARLINENKIVAVKGVGGYHIACKTTDDRVLEKLRERFSRHQQPFAVMSPDADTVETYATVSAREKEILESRVKPIVVLNKREDYSLSQIVSPGLHNIGVMLPYTGLHYILFRHINDPAIVMTSANLAGEPMLTRDGEAKEKLRDKVDYILAHNLDIANRCDDSVARIVAGSPVLIRRSRGYALKPVKVNFSSDKTVLALGAELNNTVCLLKNNKAFLSQHIGDTSKVDTLEFMMSVVRRLLESTNTDKVDCVTCDLHPQYNTTKLARELANEFDAEMIQVQHHHAHAVSLMADSNVDPDDRIIAITADGVGYGLDQTIGGGEVLDACYREFTRVGHLKQQPMPGGDQAAKYPARMLVGILYETHNPEELEDILEEYFRKREEVSVVLQQLEKKINCPLTSSTGRVLDAVSTLLGACLEQTYEGEPAMKLESLAVNGNPSNYMIPVEVKNNVVDTSLIVDSLVQYLKNNTNKRDLAAAVHHALAEGLNQIAIDHALDNGIKYVGFTGGVAYNNRFTEYIKQKVEKSNLTFLQHKQVPCGDGSLSLGQAVHAATMD